MRDNLTPNEPLDPDIGPTNHLLPLMLVGIGGAIGTGFRYLLSMTIPDVGRIPLSVFVINLTGAFLLGLLLELLAWHGSSQGVRRQLRLFLGTGILGGYTTYGTLAIDTSLLFHNGQAGIALLYASCTVILGFGASLLGIVLGRELHKRTEPNT